MKMDSGVGLCIHPACKHSVVSKQANSLLFTYSKTYEVSMKQPLKCQLSKSVELPTMLAISVATGVRLVNIRLLPFSTQHDIIFSRYSFNI